MSSKRIEQIQKTVKQLSLIVESLNIKETTLIEFDISLEKTRNLYEQLTELKLEVLSLKGDSEPIHQSTTETVIDKKEDNISVKIDEETLKYIEEKESIEFVPEIKEIEDTKNLVNELDEIVEKEINIETEEKEVNTTDTSDTIADQFEDKTSLNDVLSDIKNNDDLATQLQKRPIKDLKNAISINDKIWFTKELFDGNNDKYLSSLEAINSASSIHEAIQIADTFGWNQEESSTKRFLELVYRRFVQ